MSLIRAARAVRNLGGFAGGTSRLARPPALPEEPDIRPPRTTVCVVTIHAAATGNTYSLPRASVHLDEAGMDNPCELDVGLEEFSQFVLLIPPGDYSGVTAHVVWDAGVTAEVTLTVEDDEGGTLEAQDIVSGASTPEDLAVGPFTITADFGRVYLLADWTPSMSAHTVDPATVITITKIA